MTARDILVRLNGSHGQAARRGVLLADDVGLGKTTVAVLVAWVFAGAGKRVRILAPNDVMARRWSEELRAHVPMLQKCAPRLDVSTNRIKDRPASPLIAGSIKVAKHSYTGSLDCDLLIVDEAHRAKGEATAFSKNLRDKKKSYSRALILTATPFSIRLDELHRMLKLIDLHRYCRHLIHYELDPSPIRTVQRNGRLRRVNSWAAIIRQPILLAYPAFRGTRDHRLVQVMKKRIGAFSLLLGGVPDFDVDEITGSDEAWRNQVVAVAKTRLEQVGGQLCANSFDSSAR